MAKHVKGEPAHIPSSTYRLQLNHQCTFRQVSGLVDYLCALGIGDCYLSPFLMAAEGSMHGYDVTNPALFNPEIGTAEEFRTLRERLQQRGMGILADVVPNHMCIERPANQWWWDVLENGPSSSFARYFDINWTPPKSDLANKVLLPVLGDQYGRILEDQQITVHYEYGELFASVYQKPLPLAPRTWGVVLEPAAHALKERLGEGHEQVLELESILTALSHLAPPDETDTAKIRERQREKEVVHKRLAALTEASVPAREEIENALRGINGVKGNPHSFDGLEELLGLQSYRLSFWKVAADEINYRRFFDINELAAVRVEEPEVFQAMHALMLDLVKEGAINGLRVDHSDGLLDPAEYFRRLQEACTAGKEAPQQFYIVTEKILVGNEKLRSDWDISGTTGYDFLALVNGLFIDGSRRRAFQHLYEKFTGESVELRGSGVQQQETDPADVDVGRTERAGQQARQDLRAAARGRATSRFPACGTYCAKPSRAFRFTGLISPSEWSGPTRKTSGTSAAPSAGRGRAINPPTNRFSIFCRACSSCRTPNRSTRRSAWNVANSSCRSSNSPGR